MKNHDYWRDRHKVLSALDLNSIDRPITDLITRINRLSFCFTLQSCFGHFISKPNQNNHNLEPLPSQDCGPVRYRIAYISLCIENSAAGRAFQESLGLVAAGNPSYVQFGSADWFWERYVNSYALQVEPVRYKQMDVAMLDYVEALHVQKHRDIFFKELETLITRMVLNQKAG